MDKRRRQQFDVIEKADHKINQWANGRKIPLDNIEVVVPFVDDDFDLHVVFFFQTNDNLDAYRKDGTTVKIQERYMAILRESSYPDEWLTLVTFEYDSKENVDSNFEGSYFYRMR